MSVFFEGFGMDDDVIDVDRDLSGVDEVSEDGSIIDWNVAGEFVSPKNMTVGSNSPRFVRKATFRLPL